MTLMYTPIYLILWPAVIGDIITIMSNWTLKLKVEGHILFLKSILREKHPAWYLPYG